MGEESYSKSVFFSILKEGLRSVRGQVRLRYKDVLKQHLKADVKQGFAMYFPVFVDVQWELIYLHRRTIIWTLPSSTKSSLDMSAM